MALGGLIFAGAATEIMVMAGHQLFRNFSTAPSFMAVSALKPNEFWILFAWAPFFVLNILGEELFWRGYILPQQEPAFGKLAWAVHGSLWTAFHFAFGWQLMFVLFPFLFGLSYVAQLRSSTWVSILIHGVLNGSGFLAVALGVLK